MVKTLVICSEFNTDLVEPLYDQACHQLAQFCFENQNPNQPYKDQNIDKTMIPSLIKQSGWEVIRRNVPGVGEIPQAVQWAIDAGLAQAILALGVIIQGKTRHYDFLCGFLERALWDLQKTYSIPIIFSVLMADNREQAEERIKRGRGAEGMKSLIKMIQLRSQIKKSSLY